MDIAKLTASIKEHEGLRFLPYVDTTGNVTIGYGCNLSAGISDDEAEFLLRNRIELSIGEAEKMPWWNKVSDNDARSNALIECIYNLGARKFSVFIKVHAALCAGDFRTASAELLNSLWAKQVGKRAEVLATMVRTGTG